MIPQFVKKHPKVLLVLLPVVFLIGCILPLAGEGVRGPSVTSVLLFGWIFYPIHNIALFRPILADTLIAVSCFVIVVVCGHNFLIWLWKESQQPQSPQTQPVRPWPVRATLVLAFLFPLVFAAAITTTAVIHQTAWLARSRDDIYTSVRYATFQVSTKELMESYSKTLEYCLEHQENLSKLPWWTFDTTLDTNIHLLTFRNPKNELIALAVIPRIPSELNQLGFDVYDQSCKKEHYPAERVAEILDLLTSQTSTPQTSPSQ